MKKKQGRVALKEDIRHRGTIVANVNAYGTETNSFTTVQWDKGGTYLYLTQVLISEEEADKIEAEKKP